MIGCCGYYSCGGFSLSFLLFLCVVGCVVYVIFLLGVLSLSKYGSIGALRGVVSAMRYEVVLALVVVGVLRLGSLGILSVRGMLCVRWLFGGVFLLCALVECNRAPFDFSEGERELVRGFNVEFGGVVFTLIFLAEYGFVLGFRCVGAVLLFGGCARGVLGLSFMFLLVRSSWPRFRYDGLMLACWLRLLPSCGGFLCLCVLGVGT